MAEELTSKENIPKGWGYVEILLALTRDQFGLSDLPDSHRTLRQMAVLSAKIQKLINDIPSPADTTIHHALDLIDSIKTKLKEIGTTAAKDSDAILNGQVQPLLDKKNALTTLQEGVAKEALEKSERYLAEGKDILKNQDTPETKTRLALLAANIPALEKKNEQIHRGKDILASEFSGAVKTAIALTPEKIQRDLTKQWEEPDGPR